MGRITDRLHERGLALPPPVEPPPGVVLPFAPALVIGPRVVFSGHGPQLDDGSIAHPLGKVGAELTLEEGYEAARRTALSVLGSLERTLGDLDRITGWTRVFGMVNSAPGFALQPAVINGFSDLVLDVFGPEVGAHTRSAVGLAELPFGIPVEVEGELTIAS
jgi:hypothetical protein